MKILQLGPYPPPHGGVQTNLVAICRYLRSRGVTCAAINLTRYRKWNTHDVHYPRNALGVLRLLSQMDYDIAHLHVGGNFSFRLLALGVACSLVPGKKVILTFHSGGYPSSRDGLRFSRSKVRRLALRCFDRIIAVNSEIAGFLEQAGFPSSRIRLIRPDPPVELSTEKGLTPELARFFQNHDPVLLSVSGLEPEYNIPLQIAALSDLQSSFSKAGLIVIGSGSLEQQLRRSLQTCSHAGDVLLCGDVPHAVTLHVIKRAQVVLRMTSYDGDSIAVREALQLQTPVIATDNGMRPSGVKLIPKPTAATLRAAIEECLRDPIPTKVMYAADGRNLQEVLDVYTELLVPPTSKSPSPLHLDRTKAQPLDFTRDS